MFLVFNETRMAEEDISKVHESSSVMLIPLIFCNWSRFWIFIQKLFHVITAMYFGMDQLYPP